MAIASRHPATPRSRFTEPKTSVQPKNELVFVDAGAPNYHQLINDLMKAQAEGRRIEVVVLETGRDGIEQISEAMAERRDVSAVHIVSHGSDGSLKLGNTKLSAYNMEKYRDAIKGWQASLTEGADLLIYGCDFAGSAQGREMVESLSAFTGADVAASADKTGNVNLGGDWELEHEVGDIEAEVAFSAELQQEYSATLATETVRDEFNAVSYGGNDGTQLWTGDWQEIGGESDGPGGGDVRVTTHAGLSTNVLRIDTDVFSEGASRTVDLSSASTATLSFDYMRIAGGSIALEVHDGATWNLVNTFVLSTTDASAQNYSSDISPYVDANTQIRFIVSSANAAGKLAIDNVQIEYLSGTTGLWLLTAEDVSASGMVELPNWEAGEIIELGNPGLSLGASTSGTFSSVGPCCTALAGVGQSELPLAHAMQ